MIYLDNAATTFPKPISVVDEMSKCIKQYCGNPGRGSHKLSLKSAEKIYETRQELADLFNADPENVVFTYNTTYALNIAIKSLIKYSCHILISDIEHNSVYRPIYNLSKNKLCTFDIFSSEGTDDDILNNIKSKIQHNTKMLVCTHLSNVGSRKLPIKLIGEFCQKNDIDFIVDGAQSAGFLDIDIKEMNISALCIPGHKGLYGPQGIAAVIFNSIPKRSVIEGGTGVNSLDENMPNFLPEMLEAGTLSTPAISGWCEALKWLKRIGIDKIRQHEMDLYDYALKILKKNKNIIVYEMNNYSGSTLLFNHSKKTSEEIAYILNEHNIAVRSGFHCSPLAHKALNTSESGAVRISFSVFNSYNDVNILSEELNKINGIHL